MDHLAYKVCPASAWEEACRAGSYAGSADDRHDGFIHLSARDQVAGTLARHFAGETGLVLVTIDLRRVADPVRWEAASSGRLYPHVYGVLPAEAAVAVVPLLLGADGRHLLPEGMAC